MVVRTTETTVTFKRSFTLLSLDGPQPAGTYRLVIDEEPIEGVSFLAYRRKATMLHVPSPANSGYPDEVYFITSAELAAAQEADAKAS